MIAIIRTIPVALSIDRLRDALHNHHLPATVAPRGRDGVKITPGRGICPKAVESFVNGFVSGFES